MIDRSPEVTGAAALVVILALLRRPGRARVWARPERRRTGSIWISASLWIGSSSLLVQRRGYYSGAHRPPPIRIARAAFTSCFSMPQSRCGFVPFAPLTAAAAGEAARCSRPELAVQLAVRLLASWARRTSASLSARVETPGRPRLVRTGPSSACPPDLHGHARMITGTPCQRASGTACSRWRSWRHLRGAISGSRTSHARDLRHRV